MTFNEKLLYGSIALVLAIVFAFPSAETPDTPPPAEEIVTPPTSAPVAAESTSSIVAASSIDRPASTFVPSPAFNRSNPEWDVYYRQAATTPSPSVPMPADAKVTTSLPPGCSSASQPGCTRR